MLLSTHPIPARSPAEREGAEREGGGEGDRRGEEEEGRGVCGWRMGIHTWDGWGGGLGGDRENGELRMVIHEEGKREKMEGLLVT